MNAYYNYAFHTSGDQNPINCEGDYCMCVVTTTAHTPATPGPSWLAAVNKYGPRSRRAVLPVACVVSLASSGCPALVLVRCGRVTLGV